MIHDDRIIDPSADAVLKPVFLNSLDLPGPGRNVTGFMVRSDTSAIRTSHDTPMTVDEVDIPADNSLAESTICWASSSVMRTFT